MRTVYQQTSDPEYLEANMDLRLSLCIKVRKGKRAEDAENAIRRLARAAREVVNPEREDSGVVFMYVEGGDS